MYLGSHPSLATCKDATVEVVLATCHKVFFQAVFVILRIWDHRSLRQKAAVRESKFLASHQLAGVQMVLSSHVVQRRWSRKVVGSNQFSRDHPGLCWGESGFNQVLIWHFTATGIVLRVRCQTSCGIRLIVLGALLVQALPLARVPLLKLHGYPCRDHAAQKRRSCEVVGSDQFFPRWSRFVLGKLSLFWFVDLTLQGHWHICEVRRQPSCSLRFAWLGQGWS